MEQLRAFVSTKALRRPQARYLRAEDFEGYRTAEQPTRSERSERRGTPQIFDKTTSTVVHYN